MTDYRNLLIKKKKKSPVAQNWLQNKISVQKSPGLRHPSASSILSTSKIPETLTTSYPSQEPSNSPSPTRPQQLSHFLSLLHVHTLLCLLLLLLLWNIWNICQSRWNLQKSWYTYHLALMIITKWPCYFIYAHTPLPHHALLWIQSQLFYYFIHKNSSTFLWKIWTLS